MSLNLMDACRTGNLSAARRCVRRGDDLAQTDEIGGTPLLHASGRGYIAIVKVLLKGGADISQTDNEGTSPLFFACRSGQRPTTGCDLQFRFSSSLRLVETVSGEDDRKCSGEPRTV